MIIRCHLIAFHRIPRKLLIIWLRTKGSWVRFLPAAPVKTRVSRLVPTDPLVFLGSVATELATEFGEASSVGDRSTSTQRRLTVDAMTGCHASPESASFSTRRPMARPFSADLEWVPLPAALSVCMETVTAAMSVAVNPGAGEAADRRSHTRSWARDDVVPVVPQSLGVAKARSGCFQEES